MTAAAMRALEINGIRRLQTVHKTTQVPLRRFQHQVYMLCEALRYVESITPSTDNPIV